MTKIEHDPVHRVSVGLVWLSVGWFGLLLYFVVWFFLIVSLVFWFFSSFTNNRLSMVGGGLCGGFDDGFFGQLLWHYN